MGDEKHPRAAVSQLPEVTQYPFRRPGIQTGSGLVGDDQLGGGRRRGGDEHPPGHAAGQLKGIALLGIRPQAVPLQHRPTGLPGALVPAALADLGPHLHQRVQVGHALGHQDNLFAPHLLRPFGGKGLAQEGDLPGHMAVIRQDTQDSVGQQALTRTAGAHHRHHLAGPDGEGQILNHR